MTSFTVNIVAVEFCDPSFLDVSNEVAPTSENGQIALGRGVTKTLVNTATQKDAAPDPRYLALQSKDARFDGVFFVGVTTTGIYCRPVCTARVPRADRVKYFGSAAAAEKAGFRACFRCRPELAPGGAEVDALPVLCARAVRRIEEGALNEGSVDVLAAELGVTARHLRRAMEERLGVSPIELAQTKRLALAKHLLQGTSLGISEIAFASGFQSVRRFNAAFLTRLGRPPSEVRKLRPALTEKDHAEGFLALRLDARPPFAWNEIADFLAARAIPGVELATRDSYTRIVTLGNSSGEISITPNKLRAGIVLRVSHSLLPELMPLVSAVRRMFDLDARPDVIARALSRDATLAKRVSLRPGLRVPGALDAFESGVRTIFGQRISVRAATTLTGRFAQSFGTRVTSSTPGLTHAFPTATRISKLNIDSIAKLGVTRARAESVRAFALSMSKRELGFDLPLDEFTRALTAIPGIGPWTAHAIAMRALHHPDAFPASDLHVLRALGGNVRNAEKRAEAWRPFRAYAVMHLWHSPKEHT